MYEEHNNFTNNLKCMYISTQLYISKLTNVSHHSWIQISANCMCNPTPPSPHTRVSPASIAKGQILECVKHVVHCFRSTRHFEPIGLAFLSRTEQQNMTCALLCTTLMRKALYIGGECLVDIMKHSVQHACILRTRSRIHPLAILHISDGVMNFYYFKSGICNYNIVVSLMDDWMDAFT